MKAADMAWIVPSVVAIVGTAVGAAVYVMGHISDLRSDLEGMRPTLEREVNEAITAITQREQEALKAITRVGPTQFGAWEDRGANVDYLAETDGFVAVSAVKETIGFNILFWSGEKPEDPPLLTRANQHDGTVAPIPKGTWWTVEFHTDGGPPVHGPIHVRWLPIVRQTPQKAE